MNLIEVTHDQIFDRLTNLFRRKPSKRPYISVYLKLNDKYKRVIVWANWVFTLGITIIARIPINSPRFWGVPIFVNADIYAIKDDKIKRNKS